MRIVFRCEHCGQSLEAEADMAGEHMPCPSCERLIAIPKSVHPEVPPPVLPVTSPVCAQQPVLPKTSGMAIASMVIGILGIAGGWMCCGIILPIVAIILGHISFSQIQRRPSELTGKGLAIAGFTLGYVGLLFGLIAAFAFGTFAATMSAVTNEMNRTLGQGGGIRR